MKELGEIEDKARDGHIVESCKRSISKHCEAQQAIGSQRRAVFAPITALSGWDRVFFVRRTRTRLDTRKAMQKRSSIMSHMHATKSGEDGNDYLIYLMARD